MIIALHHKYILEADGVCIGSTNIFNPAVTMYNVAKQKDVYNEITLKIYKEELKDYKPMMGYRRKKIK